jgi:uncharacterized protein (TIGR02099 family)
MMKLKTFLRRARTLLWTAFSIVMILLAAGVGIGRLLMPYSVHYQPELEQWLSEEFGQPVAIDSFEGDWTAFGPRLTLRGLKLLEPTDTSGEGEAEVIIESAALDLRPLSYLLLGRPLYNFRVIGADFELKRTEDGEFHLSGFGMSNRGHGSALGDLARVGEVVLQDSSLEFVDDKFGIYLGATDIDGRLSLKGDVLATEISTRLFDRLSGLEYGEIDATAVLTLDEEQKVQEMEWQATGRELMAASFQGKVPANPFMPLTGWLDADTWGMWSRGGGHRINGTLDLRDALLVNDYQDLHVEHLNTLFRFRFDSVGRWNLHLADFLYEDSEHSWSTPRLSIARSSAEGAGLWISADELPLGAPLKLTRDIMSVYGKKWPANLPTRAEGHVYEFDFMLNNSWHLKLARGRLADASLLDWPRWPDLRGLDGDVVLDEGYGSAYLSGEGIRMDWPGRFRETLVFDLLSCRLDLRWAVKVDWQAGFESCHFENPDLAIYGDLTISSNEGKPAFDMDFELKRADIGRLDPYWPEDVMSENVIKWLRKGLVAGELLDGQVLIHGDMDAWPFRNGEGRFEATMRIDDARVDYLEGWPVIDTGELSLRFEGPGMEVRGPVTDTGGIAAEDVAVRIEDMKNPLLEVEYRGQSNLPDLLGFVLNTPMKEAIETDLTVFEFGGPAEVSGRILSPLGNREGDFSVLGAVRIDGGTFIDAEHEVAIEDIRGEVAYTANSFEGRALEASVRGDPVLLDLVAHPDTTERFRADIRGRLDARHVLTDEKIRNALPPLERITGYADWLVSLVTEKTEPDAPSRVTLQIQSDMVGVEMDLPAPFDKPAEEAWPIDVSLPLDDSGRMLDIVIEDRAVLRLDLPDENAAPKRVLVNLDAELAPMPPTGFLRVEGQAEMFDLDSWVSVVVRELDLGSGTGDLALEDGTMFAEQVVFLDRLFPAVDMDYGIAGDEFRASFKADDLDGSIRFRVGPTGSNSLSAEFERLVLGEPRSSGLEMEVVPRELPVLHLFARSFKYLGIELGETRIEAYPTATGFHFEKADARSDALSIQAFGDWALTENGHRSDFRINMASESVGDLLHSMEISSAMEGGQTLVNFDAWWHGSPGSFALSRLNGQLDFSVLDGNLTDASAGPGRLLGLVSFTALPKRLSLDFRDVFASGFHFDEAGGTFTLENGVAHTENTRLKSVSANIMINGQTNLVSQEYDQLITIRPGVGKTLPFIGALVSGPPGAAAGLALQGLLEKSLAEATQVSYRISGSWDDPLIEPVQVEQAEVDNDEEKLEQE